MLGFHSDGIRLFGASDTLKANLKKRKLPLVGKMCIRDRDGDFPIHKTLLGQNIPILENLKLKDVPAGEYRLYCLPLRITEGDGCWVRPILER